MVVPRHRREVPTDSPARVKPRRIVCPACGMSTWIEDERGEGCALPGCELALR